MSTRVYDGDEVDRYIGQLHQEIQQLNAELAELRQRPRLLDPHDGIASVERTLGRALLVTEEVARRLSEDAAREAEDLKARIIAAAQREAATIVEAAHREAAATSNGRDRRPSSASTPYAPPPTPPPVTHTTPTPDAAETRDARSEAQAIIEGARRHAGQPTGSEAIVDLTDLPPPSGPSVEPQGSIPAPGT